MTDGTVNLFRRKQINLKRCGQVVPPCVSSTPNAVAAKARGVKIYHLNIGQPDIETPKAYFDAVKHFDLPVLAYAPSPVSRS